MDRMTPDQIREIEERAVGVPCQCPPELCASFDHALYCSFEPPDSTLSALLADRKHLVGLLSELAVLGLQSSGYGKDKEFSKCVDECMYISRNEIEGNPAIREVTGGGEKG